MTLITPLVCLAATIFFEAGGEPLMGQVQVGHVLLNRATVEERVCDEMKKPGQFSWFPDYKKGRLKIDKNNPRWQNSIALAEEMLQGKYQEVNQGFTAFHNTTINPGWKTSRKPTKIGGHLFYKIKYGDDQSSSARFLKKSMSSSSSDDAAGFALEGEGFLSSTSKGGSSSAGF